MKYNGQPQTCGVCEVGHFPNDCPKNNRKPENPKDKPEDISAMDWPVSPEPMGSSSGPNSAKDQPKPMDTHEQSSEAICSPPAVLGWSNASAPGCHHLGAQ